MDICDVYGWNKDKSNYEVSCKIIFWGVGIMFWVIVFFVLWICIIGYILKGKLMFCFFIDFYCIVC